MRATPETVAAALLGAKKIALCGHVSPDGDCVGSMLALALALRARGRDVACFCAAPVPDNLLFLPGAAYVMGPEEAAAWRGDLAVPVDCGDAERMGGCACILKQAARTAQIDHHGTNPDYTELSWIEECPATAILINRILLLLDVKLTKEIAMCLYAALSTDTGNFAYGNTTPEAFRVGADLLEAGIPLAEMNRTLFRARPAAQLALIGRAIGNIQYAAGGRAAVTTLSLGDFEACGAENQHAEPVIDFVRDVIGVGIAVFGRETPEGTARFSLRANGDLRVDRIAAALGGGGHAQAAGCTLPLPLDRAAARVLEAVEKELTGA